MESTGGRSLFKIGARLSVSRAPYWQIFPPQPPPPPPPPPPPMRGSTPTPTFRDAETPSYVAVTVTLTGSPGNTRS